MDEQRRNAEGLTQKGVDAVEAWLRRMRAGYVELRLPPPDPAVVAEAHLAERARAAAQEAEAAMWGEAV